MKHVAYLRASTNNYVAPKKNNSGEHCTEVGAHKLANQIKKYWADKGYTINTKVVPIGFDPAMRGSSFVVRSDMANGYPIGGQS